MKLITPLRMKQLKYCYYEICKKKVNLYKLDTLQKEKSILYSISFIVIKEYCAQWIQYNPGALYNLTLTVLIKVCVEWCPYKIDV